MVYQWRKGAQTAGVPVEAAVEQIEALRSKHPEGKALREALAKASQSADAPLHPIIYDKNDKDAAWDYRLNRAGYVLRNIVLVRTDPYTERKTWEPVYVTLETRPTSENQGYTSLEVAVNDVDLREQLVAKALSDLLSWRAKYARLSDDFAPIFDAIDAFTH